MTGVGRLGGLVPMAQLAVSGQNVVLVAAGALGLAWLLRVRTS